MASVSVSAQTLTGFGIGPISGNSQFQNQTLFDDANSHPNYTNSISVQASTSPAETWSWGINVTEIAATIEVVNTVIDLTWPQTSTANSVCVIAINGAPLTYKTNPGSDGSCNTVLSGCIGDLTAAVSAGMISSDGTVQCGTALANISLPSSCSSYFTAGSNGLNVSASPMSNLDSGKAWLYSTDVSSSPSLNSSAERVWPVFLMHSSGANVTSFADPVCLQAKARPSTTTGTSSATGSGASSTSTKKSGASMVGMNSVVALGAALAAMMALVV